MDWPIFTSKDSKNPLPTYFSKILQPEKIKIHGIGLEYNDK